MTMSRTINRVKLRDTRLLWIELTRQRRASAPRVSASPDLESEEPNNFRNVFGIFINSVTPER